MAGCEGVRIARLSSRPCTRTHRACPARSLICVPRPAVSGHQQPAEIVRQVEQSVSGSGRRQLVAATLMAISACYLRPVASMAAEEAVVPVSAAAGTSGTDTIYFGNGCFWGRQYDYASVESKVLGRAPNQVTAVAGYAGGTQAGPGGKVCYYYADPKSVYERLGHAEVVRVDLTPGATTEKTRSEFQSFADTYFQKQFKKTPFGMLRLDPQDSGAGYRNVIGLPGGIDSSYIDILKTANVNNMVLKAGQGNEVVRSKPSEDDVFNTVWIVDSNTLPFYRAENYHQFHSGIGERFPIEYLRDLRNTVAGTGRIDPTGCPETAF